MMRGARTQRRGLRAMILSACAKCSRARSTTRAQTFPSAGLASTAGGSVVVMPASRRVFAEVAQDIGELQSPPQMVSERNAVLFFHSEDAHRQATDGARDSIAIHVERRVVGRADILDHVHFHPIDDGVEILAAESKIAHRREQAARAGDGLARTERIDIVAPALELLAPFTTGAARIRDIVDLTAKGIDFEHGLALRARQYAHRVVERATRRPLGRSRV